MSRNNGSYFSTRDRDNDLVDGNCAEELQAAWWYASDNCGATNLNARYIDQRVLAEVPVIFWFPLDGLHTVKHIQMSFRPRNHVSE